MHIIKFRKAKTYINAINTSHDAIHYFFKP